MTKVLRVCTLSLLISGSLGWAQNGPAPSMVPPKPSSPAPAQKPSLPGPSDTSGFQNNPGALLNPVEVMGTAAAEGLPPRDPFRLPEDLIIKLRQKNATSSTGGIDPTVDAIRRFPLTSYQLVGIIWDVKKPKAMFMDRLNSIHMLQVNDFIGNARGVLTSIQSGSVTVLEGKIPQVIKLKK